MKIAKTYSYRHALSILEKEYAAELSEVFGILKSVKFVHPPRKRTRSRKGKVVAVKSISAPETNKLIYHALTRFEIKRLGCYAKNYFQERIKLGRRCQERKNTD